MQTKVKSKLTGEMLINLFYEAMGNALDRRKFSRTRKENFLTEVALEIEAKLKGKNFKPELELYFDNVDRYTPKKFLSRQERIELLQFKLVLTVLISFVDVWDKKGLINKETAKYLKAAYSYMLKAQRAINDMLDEEEIKKQEKFFKKFRFAMLDSESIIDRDKIKKIEKYGDKYVLTEEEFLNLAEQAIEVSCKNCNKEDYKNCRFCKVMWELDVDPQSQEGCPYRMEAKA